ncbi:hypothetical protein FXO38_09529 [Capsicum annuum]|nr:hypothetical protein FXO38_09529 [Capsicum annuum]KAF3675812.1 hypothetical protein FXO37_05660 [Capsicum annuum]
MQPKCTSHISCMHFLQVHSGVCFQALDLQRQGKLMELVDETLGSDFKQDKALRMINVALLCINPSPELRPTMSAVVKIPEDHHIDLPEFNNLESRFCDDDVFRFQGLRDKQVQGDAPLEPAANTFSFLQYYRKKFLFHCLSTSA